MKQNDGKNKFIFYNFNEWQMLMKFPDISANIFAAYCFLILSLSCKYKQIEPQCDSDPSEKESEEGNKIKITEAMSDRIRNRATV